MNAFRWFAGSTLLLLSMQAVGVGTSSTCPIQGNLIQWAADYYMLKLETDDENV